MLGRRIQTCRFTGGEQVIEGATVTSRFTEDGIPSSYSVELITRTHKAIETFHFPLEGEQSEQNLNNKLSRLLVQQVNNV